MSSAPTSPWGRPILFIGTVVLLHSAYSTYEHSSISKSVGLSSPKVPLDITLETLFSLLLLLTGLLLSSQPLRPVTWASEMKKRSLDEMDARTSFATFNHRGGRLFGGGEGQ